MAEQIGARLKARKETIAIAESSSGGLLSAALLAVPGASAYFLGGAVVYTAKARVMLMDIHRESVAGMRSASEPYALLLARTARERFSATWGLSETGAAGPTGNPYGDAAGHTCIALSGRWNTPSRWKRRRAIAWRTCARLRCVRSNSCATRSSRMFCLALKALLSGIIIAVVSEVARRSPAFGALIV